MLAANPGHSATVLVALASTAGTPVTNSAGNEIKVPPPATAFSVPPITAAKNRKMAWLKCKREIYHGNFPGPNRTEGKLTSKSLAPLRFRR